MSRAVSEIGVQPERKKRSAIADFFIRLAREKPLGTFGAVIVALLLFVAIFADLIAPYGVNEPNAADRLIPPGTEYLLGTDNLGRDMLSRIVYGGRVSLIVGLAATSLSTLISLVLGLTSGYIGGKFDMIVQRFVDAWMCFPGLVLLILLVSVLGAGMWQMIFALSLMGIGGSRSIRGPVMAVRNEMYVEGARSIGASTGRILLRHVLPNVMAPTIILFSTRIPGIILSEASLSFLGLGIPPPTPSWGGMLSGSARSYMSRAPWMAIWPGLAISIVIYGINMFGDAVRDLLDPRLRGGIGTYTGSKARRKKREVKSRAADS